MSPDRLTGKGREVRRWRLHRRTSYTLADLARRIDAIVRGWMNYWGHFNRSQMYGLLRRINAYLMRWARKKYKRLRSAKRLRVWWDRVVTNEPGLFTHWAWVTDCGHSFAGR